MSVWFQGENEIDCDLARLKKAIEEPGEFHRGVTGFMPGLTRVELVARGSDSVTIETNEGVMKRTNMSQRIEPDRVVLEFDERYEAGSRITTTSHFYDEFIRSDTGVTHRLVISDLAAPGFLGLLYRKFGKSRIGNAFLAAHKAYLEEPNH